MLTCLRETLAEYERRGNFVRIYPAPGTDMYDCFFSQPRPYNRFLFKALYSEEGVTAAVSPQPAQETKNEVQSGTSPDTKP